MPAFFKLSNSIPIFFLCRKNIVWQSFQRKTVLKHEAIKVQCFIIVIAQKSDRNSFFHISLLHKQSKTICLEVFSCQQCFIGSIVSLLPVKFSNFLCFFLIRNLQVLWLYAWHSLQPKILCLRFPFSFLAFITIKT